MLIKFSLSIIIPRVDQKIREITLGIKDIVLEKNWFKRALMVDQVLQDIPDDKAFIETKISEELGVQTKTISNQISAYMFLKKTWPETLGMSVQCPFLSVFALKKLHSLSKKKANKVRDIVLFDGLSHQKIKEIIDKEIDQITDVLNKTPARNKGVQSRYEFEEAVIRNICEDPSFFTSDNNCKVIVDAKIEQLPFSPDLLIQSHDKKILIEVKSVKPTASKRDKVHIVGLMHMMATFADEAWLILPSSSKKISEEIKEMAIRLGTANGFLAIFEHTKKLLKL